MRSITPTHQANISVTHTPAKATDDQDAIRMGVCDEHRVGASGSSQGEPVAKKRRLNGPSSSASPGGARDRPIDLTLDESPAPVKGDTKKQAKRKDADAEEKRLRVFRKHPPQSYLQRLQRAQSQRMFVITRERKGTEQIPEEVFELAGTTGNIYSVTIGKMPTCTCPDSVKGNQCKHVIYILSNVLKAPANLRYQLAYVSSELREIFNQAPAPGYGKLFGKDSKNRKPIEGECPICFTEFDPETDEIVYCKASCGNNVHKECFQQWAKAQFGREIRCIYCRASWKCDAETREMLERLLEKRKQMAVNEEGYLNVARELGLSGERDMSSYHQPWVVSRGRSVRYSTLY